MNTKLFAEIIPKFLFSRFYDEKKDNISLD